MMLIKLVFGQVYGHLLSVKLSLAIFTPNTVLMVINGSINTVCVMIDLTSWSHFLTTDDNIFGKIQV